MLTNLVLLRKSELLLTRWVFLDLLFQNKKNLRKIKQITEYLKCNYEWSIKYGAFKNFHFCWIFPHFVTLKLSIDFWWQTMLGVLLWNGKNEADFWFLSIKTKVFLHFVLLSTGLSLNSSDEHWRLQLKCSKMPAPFKKYECFWKAPSVNRSFCATAECFTSSDSSAGSVLSQIWSTSPSETFKKKKAITPLLTNHLTLISQHWTEKFKFSLYTWCWHSQRWKVWLPLLWHGSGNLLHLSFHQRFALNLQTKEKLVAKLESKQHNRCCRKHIF